MSDLHPTSSGSTPPLQPPPPGKKSKSKKTPDSADASKQIAAKIAQLESDARGERDQEAEIEAEVRKATREMNNLLFSSDGHNTRADILHKKYTELYTEMKRADREHQKMKKRADNLQREKDQKHSALLKEQQKATKMEGLSRSTLAEKKKLQDELKHLQDYEGAARLELNNRLEKLSNDVAEVINQQENPEEDASTMEEDVIFRQKFKSFIDQYDLRELQFQSLLRTKELEIQYYLARYEQQKKAQQQEADKSRQLTTQVTTFASTETELRNQLNIYVEKFKQVEDTLNNSNDLFLTFRREMEEMSKKTKKLEKENLTLHRKIDILNRNMLDMAEDRTNVKKENEQLRKTRDKLEGVIRAMQAQGRGLDVNLGEGHDRDGEEGEDGESEYEYDDEDEDEGSEVEYDDETEDEVPPMPTSLSVVMPPQSSAAAAATQAGQGQGHAPQQIPSPAQLAQAAQMLANGQARARQPNGQVNGTSNSSGRIR